MKNKLVEQSIEQSLTLYELINELSIDIDQALLKSDTEALSNLCRSLNERQEEVKTNDGAILALLRQLHDLKENDQMKKLLALMRLIQERNQRLTLRLSGIMLIQRNELQKLNKGSTFLRGYRPSLQQTGMRISSTN